MCVIQHSSCVVKDDMILLACNVRLPLPATHVCQRIIVLFGKHDELQVQLQCRLVISRLSSNLFLNLSKTNLAGMTLQVMTLQHDRKENIVNNPTIM